MAILTKIHFGSVGNEKNRAILQKLAIVVDKAGEVGGEVPGVARCVSEEVHAVVQRIRGFGFLKGEVLPGGRIQQRLSASS